MYFLFEDNDEILQDMVLEDMVDIANEYGIDITISYKDYKKKNRK